MLKSKKLFLTSSANMVMRDLIKNLEKPAKGLKLAFINTASETDRGDKQWLSDDRDSLVEVGFDVFDYTITDKSEKEVAEALSEIDILFVAGGNTFYLLEKSQKCNFEKITKKLIENGVVYIGSSAGSLLAGGNIEAIKYLDDPKEAKSLKSFNAFGLTDLVVFPHWGNERFKERYLKSIDFAYDKNLKIILLTDQQYVFVEDNKYRIIDVIAKKF